MRFGIIEPELTLPVSCVRVSREPEHDRVWRTMRFDGAGAWNGLQITEHVYTSEHAGEIRFVGVDGDGNEDAHEVLQTLRTSPLRIEVLQRNRLTFERSQSLSPNIHMRERESTMHAIELLVEVAQEIEQADDEDDFASGAWS